mmetsp:Transcript_44401/g.88751  ORF Transcript_44401/g.88751 Transcript_44401/m.88751 type:complete len:305 (-) Transcript_44401:446-1360(-)
MDPVLLSPAAAAHVEGDRGVLLEDATSGGDWGVEADRLLDERVGVGLKHRHHIPLGPDDVSGRHVDREPLHKPQDRPGPVLGAADACKVDGVHELVAELEGRGTLVLAQRSVKHLELGLKAMGLHNIDHIYAKLLDLAHEQPKSHAVDEAREDEIARQPTSAPLRDLGDLLVGELDAENKEPDASRDQLVRDVLVCSEGLEVARLGQKRCQHTRQVLNPGPPVLLVRQRFHEHTTHHFMLLSVKKEQVAGRKHLWHGGRHSAKGHRALLIARHCLAHPFIRAVPRALTVPPPVSPPHCFAAHAE